MINLFENMEDGNWLHLIIATGIYNYAKTTKQFDDEECLSMALSNFEHDYMDIDNYLKEVSYTEEQMDEW